MIEKVNPSHPDKIADRIAGAIVDLAYTKAENPKVAVEILIGHGQCRIIIESSETFTIDEIEPIVERIAGKMSIECIVAKQDEHLAKNQNEKIRCGDNGIFKGVPLTEAEKEISAVARRLYEAYPTDGKFILTNDKFICCQSNANNGELNSYLNELFDEDYEIIINPLGEWSGGTDVDTGATNRKLGSDMAQSVTGGGLHGKDLSKADVSLNIYAFRKAQELNKTVQYSCAIGDEVIDGKPYSEIVEEAREYIKEIGGFEKFAEWGLF